MNWLRSVWTQLSRGVHYVPKGRKYPEVNVADVELNPPRYGFRRQRQPLLSQLATKTLFPLEEIRQRYHDHNKPVPIKFRLRSDEIAKRNWERFQDEMATGKPHFRVGEKPVYFPKARVCLLRPNAKHLPYQAKFLVPRNFNKMDLRDYLWHVYGLRALNVTVQLLHAKWNRGGDDYARYRGPQFKKMTVDMAEPFVWPEIDPEIVAEGKQEHLQEMKAILEKNRVGADQLKPKEAFDGLYDEVRLPQQFVPKHQQPKMKQRVAEMTKLMEGKADRDMVEQFLNL